jgi:hypothetical protein
VETCPHYLAFSAEEITDGDTRFKCAPPIRDEANRQSLWEALLVLLCLAIVVVPKIYILEKIIQQQQKSLLISNKLE